MDYLRVPSRFSAFSAEFWGGADTALVPTRKRVERPGGPGVRRLPPGDRNLTKRENIRKFSQ